jgi:hypothetical protein
MATAHAKRIAALRTRGRQTRSSTTVTSRTLKSNKRDALHLRITDIEAALDLVGASVRLAAPTFGAGLTGRQPAAADRFFGAFRLVPSTRRRATDKTGRPTPKRSKVRRR